MSGKHVYPRYSAAKGGVAVAGGSGGRGSGGRDSGRSPPDTDTGRVGDLKGLEASANEHGPLFGPRAAPKMEGPMCVAHLLEHRDPPQAAKAPLGDGG